MQPIGPESAWGRSSGRSIFFEGLRLTIVTHRGAGTAWSVAGAVCATGRGRTVLQNHVHRVAYWGAPDELMSRGVSLAQFALGRRPGCARQAWRSRRGDGGPGRPIQGVDA